MPVRQQLTLNTHFNIKSNAKKYDRINSFEFAFAKVNNK